MYIFQQRTKKKGQEEKEARKSEPLKKKDAELMMGSMYNCIAVKQCCFFYTLQMISYSLFIQIHTQM